MSDILEYLRKQCGMDYISDLATTDRWKKVIAKTNVSEFSLEEWNEAVHYLKNTDLEFMESDVAWSYLIQSD